MYNAKGQAGSSKTLRSGGGSSTRTNMQEPGRVSMPKMISGKMAQLAKSNHDSSASVVSNILQAGAMAHVRKMINADECFNLGRRFTIYFTEAEEGKPVKRRLNFATPRTQAAAQQLGLTFTDCVAK